MNKISFATVFPFPRRRKNPKVEEGKLFSSSSSDRRLRKKERTAAAFKVSFSGRSCLTDSVGGKGLFLRIFARRPGFLFSPLSGRTKLWRVCLSHRFLAQYLFSVVRSQIKAQEMRGTRPRLPSSNGSAGLHVFFSPPAKSSSSISSPSQCPVL